MASYHRYTEMTLNKMMLFEDVLYTSDSKKLEELKSINTDFFVVSVYPCLRFGVESCPDGSDVPPGLVTTAMDYEDQKNFKEMWGFFVCFVVVILL